MSSGLELRVGNKYRLGRKIGSGSFGDIYLGTSAERIPRLGTLRVLGRCACTRGKFSPPSLRPRAWRTRTRGTRTHRRRSSLFPARRHAHSDRRGSWHQAGAYRARASPRGNPRGCSHSERARAFFFVVDFETRSAAPRRDGDPTTRPSSPPNDRTVRSATGLATRHGTHADDD